jgi:hypothetical protein
MGNKTKTKTIVHRNHRIVQELKWVNNLYDGDGYEVRTTIKELPKYSGFDQLVWLTTKERINKYLQKQKILNAELIAKNYIDNKLQEEDPTIFDELGFK